MPDQPNLVDDLTDWSNRKSWYMRSLTHTVEVVMWTTGESSNRGPYRWNVYAYIFDNHPYYRQIDPVGSHLQAAVLAMPWHGLPSWFCAKMKLHNHLQHLEIGSDYNHSGDERFTYAGSANEAAEVFRDARQLFDWLSAKQQEADKCLTLN
jgi:hypothetical protein